jgi:FkbM family methyltransferase
MGGNSQWRAECMAGKLLSFYARSIPEHPAKIRIFKLLGMLWPELVFSYEKKARFTVILNDYIGHAICFKGSWEPQSLIAALQTMQGHDSKAFLDVGANHGIFSIVIGALTRCPILAVEPNRKNHEILERNIALNKDLNVKTISCAATAKRMGQVGLTFEGNGRGAWCKIDNNGQSQSGERVEGRPLQEILEQEKCKQVRLMKIDVEGYELEVFKGLDWESPLAPEAIIMECHPSEAEKMSFLTQKGYHPKTVDGKSINGLTTYPEGNLLFEKT